MFEELGKHYYLQGLMLAGENRITLAVNALERSAALREDNWKCWNVLGLCRYRLGQFGCAKNAWERSMLYCSNQNNTALYLEHLKSSDFIAICKKYNQGLELAQKGQYKRAEKTMEQKELLHIVPFVNFLGLCLYAQGKRKKALQVWKRSLSMDKDSLTTIGYINNCDVDFSMAERVKKFIKNVSNRR